MAVVNQFDYTVIAFGISDNAKNRKPDLFGYSFSCDVTFSDSPQTFSLAFRVGIDEFTLAAGFNLDEIDDIIILGDDIGFPDFHAAVSLDYEKTLLFEVFFRFCLSAVAEVFSLVHDRVFGPVVFLYRLKYQYFK